MERFLQKLEKRFPRKNLERSGEEEIKNKWSRGDLERSAPLKPRFTATRILSPGLRAIIQSFWKFPAIFSNTISGKSAGNLPYFVKIDLQISKFLRKIIPIKDHFLMIFSDLSLKKG